MERRNKDNRNIQKSDDNRKLLLTAKQQSGMKNVKYRSSWKEITKREIYLKRKTFILQKLKKIYFIEFRTFRVFLLDILLRCETFKIHVEKKKSLKV